jgi:hypothetical protein
VDTEVELVRELAVSENSDVASTEAALRDLGITASFVKSQLAAMEMQQTALTHSALASTPASAPPSYAAASFKDLVSLPHAQEVPSPTPSNASTETLVEGPPAISADDFHVLARLGQGAHGTVWKVKHKVTGRISAMKIVCKAGLSASQLVCIMNEQECLKRAIGIEGVLQLEASFHDNHNFYLVTVRRELGFYSHPVSHSLPLGVSFRRRSRFIVGEASSASGRSSPLLRR